MLRIKKDVDLKELKKLGYKEIEYRSPFGKVLCYIKEGGYDCLYQKTTYTYITKFSCGRCYSFNRREKGYETPNFADYIECDEKTEQVLFENLIQAGLVEKVEEEQ